MKVNIMEETFAHHVVPGLHGRIYPYENDFEHRDSEQYPLVNIAEDNNSLYVRALIPGADPSHIQLKVHEGMLTLEGSIPSTGGTFHRQERFSGPFRRELALKSAVVPHMAQAVIKHGVLDVILPKAL